MASAAIPIELADLVMRLARHRRGVAFLHQGYLENVAITLGVHPFVLDAAREWMETPGGRAALIEEVRRAPGAEAGEFPRPPDGEGEALALVRAAETRPGGLDRLAGGSVDEAAKTFAAHPYLVLRARGILQRRQGSGASR